jgi:hypothetical protein
MPLIGEEEAKLKKDQAAEDAREKAAKVPMAPIKVSWAGKLYQGRAPLSFADAPVEGGILLLEGDTQTEEIALTPLNVSEQQRLVTEILMEGKATHKFLLADMVEIVFEEGSVQDGLEANILPEGYDIPKGATNAWMTDIDAVRKLAVVLKKYGDKSIGATRIEREQFVQRLPQSVYAYLIDEFNRWKMELRDLLRSHGLGDVLGKS